MYSTCLFCHTQLGANEAVEHFPVGRRLAFDAAKGRLWVVCRKCERWNLTPIEERWEAIEECERSFRDTKLRVSTTQIGMARLAEGLELVRIGKPLRPEFAAWRYGDQFGRRRRRNILKTGAVMTGIAAIPLIGVATGGIIAAGGYWLFDLGRVGFFLYHKWKVAALVHTNDGRILPVRVNEVSETALLPPTASQPWGLRITHRAERGDQEPIWRYAGNDFVTELRGDDALRAAAQLLPRLNQSGASKRELEKAIEVATETVDPAAGFDKIARTAAIHRVWHEYGKGAMLKHFPGEMRLALEMLSHEESERRALEGELSLLEDAWREAEEIAAISDDMFLPIQVSEALAKIKGSARQKTR